MSNEPKTTDPSAEEIYKLLLECMKASGELNAKIMVITQILGASGYFENARLEDVKNESR